MLSYAERSVLQLDNQLWPPPQKKQKKIFCQEWICPEILSWRSGLSWCKLFQIFFSLQHKQTHAHKHTLCQQTHTHKPTQHIYFLLLSPFEPLLVKEEEEGEIVKLDDQDSGTEIRSINVFLTVLLTFVEHRYVDTTYIEWPNFWINISKFL